MTDLRENFEKWAKLNSGFEGGNIDSPYWFCGIEYGGEFDFSLIEKLQLIQNDETQELYDINGEQIPCWKDDADYSYSYTQKVSKLISCHKDGALDNWREHQKNLFTKSGDTFKMNLFPINFLTDLDRLWTKRYKADLKFRTKRQYQLWCKRNRFPKLKELVLTHKPKVLICAGIGKIDFYKKAFLEKGSDFQEIQICDHRYFYTKIEASNTLILVTPFFGWGGITKDTEITTLSKKIFELIG